MAVALPPCALDVGVHLLLCHHVAEIVVNLLVIQASDQHRRSSLLPQVPLLFAHVGEAGIPLHQPPAVPVPLPVLVPGECFVFES